MPIWSIFGCSLIVMKFEIHRKVRWELDRMSEEEYFGAVAEYYRHLSRLDLSKNKTILRYFGDSFLHGAEVRESHFHHQSAALELKFDRLDDLEDINSYRERKRLTPIPRYRYLRNPIVYICRRSNGPANKKCQKSSLNIDQKLFTHLHIIIYLSKITERLWRLVFLHHESWKLHLFNNKNCAFQIGRCVF